MTDTIADTDEMLVRRELHRTGLAYEKENPGCHLSRVYSQIAIVRDSYDCRVSVDMYPLTEKDWALLNNNNAYMLKIVPAGDRDGRKRQIVIDGAQATIYVRWRREHLRSLDLTPHFEKFDRLASIFGGTELDTVSGVIDALYERARDARSLKHDVCNCPTDMFTLTEVDRLILQSHGFMFMTRNRNEEFIVCDVKQ